jgi:hypothetical protein
MFKLKNIEGKIDLTLEVVGYQFPDSDEDDWCNLKVTVEQEKERCELVDPALETTELVQLLLWFSSLSECRLPRYAHLTFTELCISFEFLAFKDDVVRIAIHLSHELKPEILMKQLGSKSEDWCVIFELGSENFSNIRNGMKSALERCPIRES